MARPERNNVDYFPFICKEGKVMFFIEEKYGNDGFSTWIKVLRQLAVTNYHYLNLKQKVELMFLSSKCRVDENVLISIINDLCEMGEFNKDLWYKERIIFSEKFINHIEDAYLKRNNKCINLLSLFQLLDSLGILKLCNFNLKVASNTQRKGKYTKEEKSKQNSIIPTVNDVVLYFKENGFSEDLAKRAFGMYESNDWFDTKGNKVKNWKMKMQSVWFKEENKKEIVLGYSPNLTN